MLQRLLDKKMSPSGKFPRSMLDDDCAIAKLLHELNAEFVALIGGLTNVPADAVRHRDQKQKKAKFAKGDEVDVAMGDKRVAGHIAACNANGTLAVTLDCHGRHSRNTSKMQKNGAWRRWRRRACGHWTNGGATWHWLTACPPPAPLAGPWKPWKTVDYESWFGECPDDSPNICCACGCTIGVPGVKQLRGIGAHYIVIVDGQAMLVLVKTCNKCVARHALVSSWRAAPRRPPLCCHGGVLLCDAVGGGALPHASDDCGREQRWRFDCVEQSLHSPADWHAMAVRFVLCVQVQYL